jgi:hypothetical protein
MVTRNFQKYSQNEVFYSSLLKSGFQGDGDNAA